MILTATLTSRRTSKGSAGWAHWAIEEVLRKLASRSRRFRGASYLGAQVASTQEDPVSQVTVYVDAPQVQEEKHGEVLCDTLRAECPKTTGESWGSASEVPTSLVLPGRRIRPIPDDPA